MPTVTVAHAPSKPLSFLEERLLRAAYEYHFLTAPDAAHLGLCSPNSLTYIREVLRRLAGGADYVDRQFLYRWPVPNTTKGAKPRVYALGTKGHDVLAEEGYYRPYKLRSLSYSHLWHALTLTRFCVAAHAWCRTHPEYVLEQTRLSYELAHTPPTITLESEGQSTQVPVIPDAWLLFARSDGKKFPVLIEIDRGTEYQERFKQHVRARLELIRSDAYKHYFGLEAVLIAYVTTSHTPAARHTRRATMQRWTHELLAQLELSDWGSLFRFAAVEYETLYHAPIFTAPVWYQTGTPTTPAPLLAL